MTIERTRTATEASARVLWSSPEQNLWVANREGEYAGMVEFANGHFLARDRTGNFIDAFTDVPSAKTAVISRAAVRNSLRGAVTAAYQHLGTPHGVNVQRVSKHYRRSA